jgi:hypothetical protein
MEDIRNFSGKTRSKETARRPNRMWMYNTKMDLKEIEWVGMDWIHLA